MKTRAFETADQAGAGVRRFVDTTNAGQDYSGVRVENPFQVAEAHQA